MKLFDVYPRNNITISKGNGSFVWDADDNKYLDLYGGHAVISIGHSHPHYIERLQQQLAQIGFYSNTIHVPLQEELAAKLGKVSGKNDYQLFLCNSGAEANENAIKLASFATGRSKVIAFSKSFHGRTSLAVEATDNPDIVAPVNRSGNIIFLPFNDRDLLERCFNQYGNDIAAVIIESVQGVGGINIASTDFLREIRRLCDQYGSVCIADEVQCGYGRSGKFYAFDHSGMQADIYTMAKGIGNGFPVGAIAIAPSIKAKHGMLGSTFGGNHLACAAALAVLEVIESSDLINNAETLGDYIQDELRSLGHLQNVRGRGLMIGFNVPESRKDLRATLLNKHKIFTGEAKPDVIRLLPSLNLMKEEADIFLGALRQELNSVAASS